MTITDINDCLSELPEISPLEYFRPRAPIANTAGIVFFVAQSEIRLPLLRSTVIASAA